MMSAWVILMSETKRVVALTYNIPFTISLKKGRVRSARKGELPPYTATTDRELKEKAYRELLKINPKT